MQTEKVTICICASRNIIDADRAAALAVALAKGGCAVSLEADLCAKIRKAAGGEAEAASGTAQAAQREELAGAAEGTVVACYPRAVRSLFDTLGVTPRRILDIRNNSVESILDKMQLAPTENGTDAWYPVVDKERCNECEKCHDFCLFNVYAVEDGRVVVRRPENCKNNCPACARLCPSGAIIFPKYDKSPINGGLEEEEQAVSLDTGAIYGEALRERLARRKAGIPLFKRDEK